MKKPNVLPLLPALGLAAALLPSASRAEPVQPECLIFGEAEAEVDAGWMAMDPDLFSYEDILQKPIRATTPNGCAKAAQSLLGTSIAGRKIVAVRFSFSSTDLAYRAIRTAETLDLRMSNFGQRGMSSVVAHGIAEAMGPLTGYLCKVCQHAAEGVDTVTVKARYGSKR